MKFHSYKYFLNKKFNNWNPDKFDWETESGNLVRFCGDYFDIWWDANKFNWKSGSCYLTEYCNEYFAIWWNKKKFNWRCSSHLAQYCYQYFDKWWDADRFDNEERYPLLLDYCLDYISIWWDLEKVIKYFHKYDIEYLIRKNNEYKLLPEEEIKKLTSLK